MEKKDTEIDDDLVDTYESLYLPILQEVFSKGEYTKPSRAYLSQSILAAAGEILVAMKNNVQLNFLKRRKQFLKMKGISKKEDLKKAMDDLTSTPLPEIPANSSIEVELERNPWFFIKSLWQMNQILEIDNMKSKENLVMKDYSSTSLKKKRKKRKKIKQKEQTTPKQTLPKLFSFLPIRKGYIPRNIKIVTADFKTMIGAAKINITKVDVILLIDEDVQQAYQSVGKWKSLHVDQIITWLLSKQDVDVWL